MKRWSFGLILVLCILVLAGCSEQDVPSTFFELIEFSSDDVEKIIIERNDEPVELIEAKKEELLACLEQATEGRLCKQQGEAYPYTPSDYAVTFVVDGEEIEVCFSWFTGKFKMNQTSQITGTYVTMIEYQDTRVDVLWKGVWYSFNQNPEQLWHEDEMEYAYERSANVRRIKLTPQYVADGYEELNIQSFSCYSGIEMPLEIEQWQGKSYAEIIEAADIFLIAKSEGLVSQEEYEKAPVEYDIRCNYEKFTVEEVLKGSCEEQEIFIKISYGEVTLFGKKYVTFQYPPLESPFFEEGNSYVLCLSDDPYGKFEDCYELQMEHLSSGLILDDIVYPRYNTEHHPFSAVPLEEIRRECE